MPTIQKGRPLVSLGDRFSITDVYGKVHSGEVIQLKVDHPMHVGCLCDDGELYSFDLMKVALNLVKD